MRLPNWVLGEAYAKQHHAKDSPHFELSDYLISKETCFKNLFDDDNFNTVVLRNPRDHTYSEFLMVRRSIR